MPVRSLVFSFALAAVIVGGMAYAAYAGFLSATYHGATLIADRVTNSIANALPSSTTPAQTGYTLPDDFGKTQEVRAIYATVGTIRDTNRRAVLIKLINDTELNAIVVDAGDSKNIYFDDAMRTAVAELRQNNIYPIVRIPVFQHDGYALSHHDVALKLADGKLWSERGRYWVDPASRQVWDHTLEIARQAIAMGFAEINLDYVRFPSDGSLGAIHYPYYDGVTPKDKVMEQFFSYVGSKLKEQHPNIVLSVDIFGYVLLSDIDAGIGQRVTSIAPHVDVIAPMVYPSHYSKGNFGFDNPAAHPYEVVRQTLARGLGLLAKLPAEDRPRVRPWLQDFDMGATYGKELVQAQMKAVHAAGLSAGWMMWNPSNVYVEAEYTGLPVSTQATSSTSTIH